MYESLKIALYNSFKGPYKALKGLLRGLIRPLLAFLLALPWASCKSLKPMCTVTTSS